MQLLFSWADSTWQLIISTTLNFSWGELYKFCQLKLFNKNNTAKRPTKSATPRPINSSLFTSGTITITSTPSLNRRHHGPPSPAAIATLLCHRSSLWPPRTESSTTGFTTTLTRAIPRRTEASPAAIPPQLK